MATDRTRRSDNVQARLNGDPFDPDFDTPEDAKGPDEDRLEEHAAERRAWTARLRREEAEDE